MKEVTYTYSVEYFHFSIKTGKAWTLPGTLEGTEIKIIFTLYHAFPLAMHARTPPTQAHTSYACTHETGAINRGMFRKRGKPEAQMDSMHNFNAWGHACLLREIGRTRQNATSTTPELTR